MPIDSSTPLEDHRAPVTDGQRLTPRKLGGCVAGALRDLLDERVPGDCLCKAANAAFLRNRASLFVVVV